MKFMFVPNKSNEKGFTLIELMIVVALIGILASIALTSYALYKDNAEFSRAEITMHNARTALEAGIQDLPASYSLALTQSTSTGGGMTGDLVSLLPGAMVPNQVNISAQYDSCTSASSDLDINAIIISNPCKARNRLQWIRFCGGLELLDDSNPRVDC